LVVKEKKVDLNLVVIKTKKVENAAWNEISTQINEFEKSIMLKKLKTYKIRHPLKSMATKCFKDQHAFNCRCFRSLLVEFHSLLTPSPLKYVE
jgi:hypothetical protein